ncbi:MAG: 23S rRNA (pseudouridine(1915)-N(3))-methyltransferase RlmH [Betaproteobacteria bacterium]|nr:23S rRNA (pseudouridine(1915)-N(3))-methyltransferase RlmH [Betaproteobacteria bacterium]
MKFVIVAVGHRMPAWIDAGFNEYAQRMPRETRIDLAQIKPEGRGGRVGARPVAQLLEAESGRIRAALPAGCCLVVLDERGAQLTTAQLAQRVARWKHEGRDVAFVIGGADGIAPELKRSADLSLALSSFTLPHGLARVVLAEQLYRAVSLLAGHPYHRE